MLLTLSSAMPIFPNSSNVVSKNISSSWDLHQGDLNIEKSSAFLGGNWPNPSKLALNLATISVEVGEILGDISSMHQQ